MKHQEYYFLALRTLVESGLFPWGIVALGAPPVYMISPLPLTPILITTFPPVQPCHPGAGTHSLADNSSSVPLVSQHLPVKDHRITLLLGDGATFTAVCPFCDMGQVMTQTEVHLGAYVANWTLGPGTTSSGEMKNMFERWKRYKV